MAVVAKRGPRQVTPRTVLVLALVLGLLGMVGAAFRGTYSYSLTSLSSDNNQFRAGVVDIIGNGSLPCPNRTATSTPTLVPTASRTPTSSPTPSPVGTATPGPSLTPSPSSTSTQVPTPTRTPIPSPTNTPVPQAQASATRPGANETPSDCTQGTGSTLTDTTRFGWSTSGGGTDCAMARNAVSNTRERSQAMAPGAYCVAPITIRNTSNRALDAWLRIRVFRATAAAATGSATERLNDKLRFYIHEYSGGTLSGQHLGTNVYEAGTTEQARDLDCTTATYKPSTFTSSATIASDRTATTVQSRVPGAPAWVVRTALTSVGDSGRVIGNGGLGLVAGPGGAPTTSNVVTNPGSSRNAVNIVGSDEINDPAGALQTPSKPATNTAGTQVESLITGGSVKLYCMAVFWPDDTDLSQGNANLTAANTLGDNLLALGSLSYYLTVDAAQRSGR